MLVFESLALYRVDMIKRSDGLVHQPFLVPGVIGILEALEAIKIITGINNVLSGRLMLFDGIPSTFRNIALRKRNANCDVCGDSPSIKSLIDYEQFCGARADDKVIKIGVLFFHKFPLKVWFRFII